MSPPTGNGGRRGFRSNNCRDNKKTEVALNPSDELNPVIIAFRQYAKELEEKQDRYERIVKLSRDITIESKRIIFLLHTIDSKKDNKDKILEEARKRLQSLFDGNFFAIAKELNDLDQYQYGKAYSAGLQEFVEAFLFYELLSGKLMSDWNDLQKRMSYEHNFKAITEVSESALGTEIDSTDKNNGTKISCMIQPIEYVLGFADTTGEIMRRCINSLGCGDIEVCFDLCKILQAIYTCYLGLNAKRQRDLCRKMCTLRQSVQKAENVCYNIKVRGREAAIWGSVRETNTGIENDEDEGFY